MSPACHSRRQHSTIARATSERCIFGPVDSGVNVSGRIRLGDCAGIAAIVYHEGTKGAKGTKRTTEPHYLNPK